MCARARVFYTERTQRIVLKLFIAHVVYFMLHAGCVVEIEIEKATHKYINTLWLHYIRFCLLLAHLYHEQIFNSSYQIFNKMADIILTVDRYEKTDIYSSVGVVNEFFLSSC